MAQVHYSYGTLVDSLEIIVSDNDPVNAKMKLGNEDFPISIVFIPDPNPETKDSALSWKNEAGVLNFTFYGWGNSLGTTTKEINTHIGKTNPGEDVYILVAHNKVGVANHLVMQLVLGNVIGES